MEVRNKEAEHWQTGEPKWCTIRVHAAATVSTVNWFIWHRPLTHSIIAKDGYIHIVLLHWCSHGTRAHPQDAIYPGSFHALKCRLQHVAIMLHRFQTCEPQTNYDMFKLAITRYEPPRLRTLINSTYELPILLFATSPTSSRSICTRQLTVVSIELMMQSRTMG